MAKIFNFKTNIIFSQLIKNIKSQKITKNLNSVTYFLKNHKHDKSIKND